MKRKKDPGGGYAAFYRALSLAAVYFAVSVCTSGIYHAYGAEVPGLLANLVLLGAGYAAMSLTARLMRLKRKSDSRGYESDGGYFSARYAVLPVALAVVIGFVVRALAAKAEYLYAMNTPGVAYDPDSLLPITVMLFCTAMMTGGIMLWFVPYERLVSQRTVVICITALFIGFAFWTYGGSGCAVSGLCLIGFCISEALSLNQNSLTRTYRGTVMAFISPRARRYNMRLALAFCAFVLILSLGGWVITVGLATIAKAILYLIVNSKTAPGDDLIPDGSDPVDRGMLFNMYVFGAKKADDSVNYRIFVVFSVVSVLALIVFLARRQADMRRLIEAVKRGILSFIDFIFSPISDSMTYFKSNLRREDDNASFTDEEEKLISDPKIGEERNIARRRSGWREFSAGLRAQKDDRARLCYAYAVYASQLHAIPQFAKKSDTARELHGKVRRRRICTDDDIAGITAAFERAKYSGDIDPAEARMATEKLCRIIRRSMD